MLVPVRCFGCGKPLSDKYDEYMERLKKEFAKKKTTYDEIVDIDDVETFSNRGLNSMDIDRECCRKTMLASVDMFSKI